MTKTEQEQQEDVSNGRTLLLRAKSLCRRNLVFFVIRLFYLKILCDNILDFPFQTNRTKT